MKPDARCDGDPCWTWRSTVAVPVAATAPARERAQIRLFMVTEPEQENSDSKNVKSAFTSLELHQSGHQPSYILVRLSRSQADHFSASIRNPPVDSPRIFHPFASTSRIIALNLSRRKCGSPIPNPQLDFLRRRSFSIWGSMENYRGG